MILCAGGVLSDNSAQPEDVWKNRTVINSYINYCQSQADASAEKALCYVSGEYAAPARQHLKGVVSFAGNAKLVSANDKANFTYRGRFTDDSEALTMGFISSQKAHNALKWIVSNDGFSFGGRLIVCWNPKGKRCLTPRFHCFLNFQGPEKTRRRQTIATFLQNRSGVQKRAGSDGRNGNRDI